MVGVVVIDANHALLSGDEYAQYNCSLSKNSTSCNTSLLLSL